MVDERKITEEMNFFEKILFSIYQDEMFSADARAKCKIAEKMASFFLVS